MSDNNDAIFRLLDRPIADGDLAAGAEAASRAGETRSMQTTRVLLFRVGNETAALSVKSLRRVTHFARVSPVPHRSGGILRGVCNIRGELVLCADLRRLLGMPPGEGQPAPTDVSNDSRRMIVIGPPEDSWAFEVDALIGVENVRPEEFREPPVTVEYAIGAVTLGVTEVDGACVTVLDGDRVLAGFKAALA